MNGDNRRKGYSCNTAKCYAIRSARTIERHRKFNRFIHCRTRVIRLLPSRARVSFERNCKIRGGARLISNTIHCVNCGIILTVAYKVTPSGATGFRVVILAFIIHCDTVNSRARSRTENGKRESVVKRRSFGFFQKPDVAGALMGHARAFTRKLWKSTVTICEAADSRWRSGNVTGGAEEGGGRQEFTGNFGWTRSELVFLRADIIDFLIYIEENSGCFVKSKIHRRKSLSAVFNFYLFSTFPIFIRNGIENLRPLRKIFSAKSSIYM